MKKIKINMDYKTEYYSRFDYHQPNSIHEMKNGYKVKILGKSTVNKKRLIIKFLDKTEYITDVSFKSLREGTVINPYHKNILGVACFGEGKYIAFNSKTNRSNWIYDIYFNVIDRCYNPYAINRDKGLNYVDVFVCDEWLNYQDAAKWIDENYIEGYELDKDLFGNGKLYSPHTCCFLPKQINCFLKYDYSNNKSGFKGVVEESRYSKIRYRSELSFDGHSSYLGTFDTKEEARKRYLEEKKKVAEILIKRYDVEDRVANKIREYVNKLK